MVVDESHQHKSNKLLSAKLYAFRSGETTELFVSVYSNWHEVGILPYLIVDR
jgi:hypothetical protein